MGLSLRNIKKKIVDVFDANTQADQQRRVAAGQPRMYQQQQAQSGAVNPISVVAQVPHATKVVASAIGKGIYETGDMGVNATQYAIAKAKHDAVTADYTKNQFGQSFNESLPGALVRPFVNLGQTLGTGLAAPGIQAMEARGEIAPGEAERILNEGYNKAGLDLNQSKGTAARKIYGNAGQAAFNVATLGTGAEAATIEGGLAATVKSMPTIALKYGVPAGTLQTIQEDKPGWKNLATNVATNTAVAGVTPVVMGAAGEAVRKATPLNEAGNVSLPGGGSGKPKVTAKKLPTDAEIQKQIKSHSGAGGKIEKAQAKLTEEQRLAATHGDTGMAGLQMDPTARQALLAKTRAAAAEAEKPQIRLKNSELPKDHPLYMSPAEEAALKAQVPKEGKFSGDLPINKPTVKAKGAPEGVGTIPLDQLGPPKTAEARTVEGKVMKDPTVKKVFDNLSKADRISKTEQGLTATAIEQAAKKHGIDTADLNVWDRLQTGKPKNVAERRFFKDVKAETDRIFKLQQQVDPSIVYRENYLPGKYAQQGTPAYDDAIQQLKSVTGSEQAKSFDTYRQAKDIGGLDPKYKTLQETLASNAGEAQKALFTKQAVDAGLADGVFDTKPLNRNWKQVEGMYTSDGAPVYASKAVADRINNAMQAPSDFVGKTIEKAAKVSGGMQQIALTGGVPNTSLNAFGISQEFFQGMGYGRPGVITDMVHSFTKQTTQERFNAPKSVAKGLSTPEFVRQAELKGANIGQITSDASTMNQGGIRRIANKASGEQATFQQLMPNIKLSILEDTYKKFVGEMGHDKALQVAADTVNKATGFVDEIGKGRSVNARNLKSATLFAPQYREAVIGQLSSAVEAWLPKNLNNPTFNYGRRFAAGLLTTAGIYDALNYKLNGHHMWDNRNGQELSLQIPTGEKDEKGNQPVVNIPLFPSILTIPRAVVNGVTAGIRGDKKAVVKEASKVLATPIQVGGQILSNRDYFDRPIYNDAQTAADQGIAPDNAAEVAGKVGVYAAKQLTPGPIRAALDKLGVGRDEPVSWGQFAAAATEAPVRFGKQLNPATEAYFKDRDQVYGALNKNDKAIWDAIHPPIKKNVNGEYITDKTVWSGATRAANYLNSPNVLAAENEMAARAKARGEAVDPLFGDLKGQQQLIALTIDTLPPKDPNKTILKEQNPWYDAYYQKRQAFFDSLPPGDPNKPKGPIAYPEPSGQVASLQDAYYQLTDSKARAQMMENNPELADQFAKEEQYARAVRAAKNLPQYDRYPQATPQVQRLIDEYSALPSKESGGKSRIRSAWIKSHPKEWALMSDQFSKQAQYNLQQDASLASFEGRDLTEKGIKAITSLAKDLGMSTGGGYGGGYGGGSGSSSSNPYQYAVSLKAGKVSLKGKAAQPKKSKGTSKRYTVAKPKVTSKKSRV